MGTRPVPSRGAIPPQQQPFSKHPMRPNAKPHAALDIAKLIHFPFVGDLKIQRKPKFGGDVTFKTYDDLSSAFTGGELHPLDLKLAIADSISNILAPARDYFDKHPEKIELLTKYKITK